jgi:hypothetical protein
MRKFLLPLVAASVLSIVACGSSGPTSASSGEPQKSGSGAGSGGGSGAGSGGSGGGSGGGETGSGGGSGSSSGGVTSGDAGGADTSACAAIIGSWVATIEPGATATGTATTLLGGNVAVGGTITFTLSHDDADLPNIVDFHGTAAITAAGQTFNEVLQPAAPADSGDPKDVTCDAGLHLHGTLNVQGAGDILFAVDGTLDSTSTSGEGTFSMKSADDNGASLTATGKVKVQRQ